MRRPGEVRTVLVSTLRQQGPLPLCDLAARSQVGYDATRETISNGLRAGWVEKVGSEKRAHCKKWVALYGLPEPAAEPHTADNPPLMVLGAALNNWR